MTILLSFAMLREMIGQTVFLLLGGEGHLGTALLQQLEKSDADVRVLYLKEPTWRSSSPRVRYYPGDVTRTDTMRPLFEGLSERRIIVVHLAAVIDITSRRLTPLSRLVNYEGVRNSFFLFQKYHGTRFIYLSSVDAFRPVKTVVNETSSLYENETKAGAYPISKSMATRFIKDKQKEGADALILYPSAMLGPYDEGHNAVVQLLRDYLHGKIPGVIPGSYGLVDVRDVAQAIVTLSEGTSKGDSFILTSERVKIADLLRLAKKWNHGQGKPVMVFPYWLAYVGLPFLSLHCRLHHRRPLYTSFSLSVLRHANTFSNQKARQAFAFCPRPAEKSVFDTLDYLAERKLVVRH